jgi:ankyrin repeat protein/cellobiose-specific phosphotransferase system component IIA
MQKNDTSTLSATQMILKLREQLEHEDEQQLPDPTEQALQSTEEAEDSDADAEVIDAAQQVLRSKHESKDELINALQSIDDERIRVLILHLQYAKMEENITYKILFKHLMKYIIKLIAKKKPATERKKILLNGELQQHQIEECNDLKFFLAIFDFGPNTVVSNGDKKNYNIIMLASENLENPHFLQLLVNELEGDVSQVLKDGTQQRRTALHIACEVGNLEGVKTLIAKGAEINTGKITPLDAALTNGRNKVVEYLLTQEQLNPNHLSDGVHPLLIAAQYSTVQVIITMVTRRGVNPNTLSREGMTALHAALLRWDKERADKEREAIILFFLNSPSFTIHCDTPYLGETGLFTASRLGNVFALDLLLKKGADPTAQVTRGPRKGHTVFSIAVFEGNLAIVQRLLPICQLDFLRPLTISSIPAPMTLLDLASAHPKVTGTDSSDHTSIYLLLQQCWIATNPEQVRIHIGRLIKEENIIDLRTWKMFLLSDNSTAPETGNTPLLVACKNNKFISLELLTSEMGVNPHKKNLLGNNALHLACQSKNAIMLSRLLELECDPDQLNNAGETPFDIAKKRNDEACLGVLIKHRITTGQAVPTIESSLAEKHPIVAKILLGHCPVILPQIPESSIAQEPSVKTKPKKRRNKATRKEPTLYVSPVENGLKTLPLIASTDTDIQGINLKPATTINAMLPEHPEAIYSSNDERQKYFEVPPTSPDQPQETSAVAVACVEKDPVLLKFSIAFSHESDLVSPSKNHLLKTKKKRKNKKRRENNLTRAVTTIQNAQTLSEISDNNSDEIHKNVESTGILADQPKATPELATSSIDLTQGLLEPAMTHTDISQEVLESAVTPTHAPQEVLQQVDKPTDVPKEVLESARAPTYAPQEVFPGDDIYENEQPEAWEPANSLPDNAQDNSADDHTAAAKPKENLALENTSKDESHETLEEKSAVIHAVNKSLARENSLADELVDTPVPAVAINHAPQPASPPLLPDVRSWSTLTLWAPFKTSQTPTRIRASSIGDSSTPLSIILELIKKQLQFISTEQPEMFIKCSLELLADYHASLNYFAIIGEISTDSPLLIFLLELHTVTTKGGFSIIHNVEQWKNRAIEVYEDNFQNLSWNMIASLGL